MASASKITSAFGALMLGAWFTGAAQAQEPHSCSTTVLTHDAQAPIPNDFFYRFKRIQLMLADIELENERGDKSNLLNADDVASVFLNEQLIQDPDQLAGIRTHEMPKYCQMIETLDFASDPKTWAALSDLQRRQAMADVKLGIAGLYSVIPVEILEDVGLVETVENELAAWDKIAPLEFEANDMDKSSDPTLACGDHMPPDPGGNYGERVPMLALS